MSLEKVLALKNSAALENMTTKYQYANLLNLSDADFAPGKYVNYDTGTLSTNASYNTSGYIAVMPGQKIILTIASFGRVDQLINYIAGYNAQKTYVSASGGTYLPFYIVPAGVYYIRLTYDPTQTEQMIEVDSGYGVSDDYLTFGTSKNIEYNRAYDVDVYTPQYVYVAVGSTVEIYFRAFAPLAWGKLTYTVSVSINTTNPTITRYADKIKIVAASAGIRLARVNGYDVNGCKVFSKLIVIRGTAASTATKKLLCIGDSLSNDKYWLPELIKYNTNLSLVGGKSFTLNDSGATSRTGKHSGFSGWAAKTYMTLASSSASGSSETNPFWDTALNEGVGGFSFAYYVTNTLSGVAPDIVQIYLGMNGLINDPTSNVAFIKAMVDAIRTAYPAMPIILVAPQYQQYERAALQSIQTFNLVTAIYSTFAAYTALYIVPLWLCFDSTNGYYSGTETINPRSTTTQPAVPDVIHPPTAAQYQIADVIFGTLSQYFAS